MKKCSNCGYEGNGSFCPECGNEMKAKRNSKRLLFSVIIGIVLGLVVAIYIIGDNSISIIEGEQGKYGELMTFNEGTEFEETKYYYVLPVGIYKVINKGEYPVQISNYDGKHVNESGWEEPETVYGACVINPNDELTIMIKGGYIEISENAKLKFIPEKD